MSEPIDDIENAIERASDVLHNSREWEAEGVYAEYIVPALDRARAALALATQRAEAAEAERDALRVLADGLKEVIGLLRGSAVAGWCAECKGSGYITTHLGSEGSGTVATRKCVCGGNPFLRNATAEFWLEER